MGASGGRCVVDWVACCVKPAGPAGGGTAAAPVGGGGKSVVLGK
jgi:hypothetical protein